ncbi:MAG: tRNA1(Val) (adenine(37)-N6)-methyltransferase [Prevotella sp.]
MANSVFTFKQFKIEQSGCAMKVGTDGVLLGAWAKGGERILDIGTGSGLIALMMAQRCSLAQIVALDIDEGAYKQAVRNVEDSVFSDRISVVYASLQDYCKANKTELKGSFDAIVSNPPFFVNSLKSKGDSRTMARHTDRLSFAELLRWVAFLLREQGSFSCIIPSEVVNDFLSESYICGLSLMHHVAIKTVENKNAKRHLLCLVKGACEEEIHEEQVLKDAEGKPSLWYNEITKAFYL